MKSSFAFLNVILFLCLSGAGFAQTTVAPGANRVDEPVLQRLEREIGRAAKLSGGTVGVSAIHMETERRVDFNSKERFPMASTYKVPIAVQFLSRVDRGEVSLAQMVEIKQCDLHPGSGILTDLLNKPGVVLSAQNLLELMLVVSDNSAADLLLRLAGGPEAVAARMREMGIADMDVNRPTVLLLADATGYVLPPEKEWTPALFKRLDEETTPATRKEAARKFESDLRDTSTPEAMANLLEKVYRGDVLKKESRALFLEILERCQTGKKRLKGILFPETIIAHKTGTLGATASDTGVITLPDQAGHVAIAVFVKSADKEIQDRERAIAHIGRSVYDYFLFQTASFPVGK
jgi:beta-lactamase class A